MLRKLPILTAIAVAVVATALVAGVGRASAEPIIVLHPLAQPDLVVESVTTGATYQTVVTIKNLPASSGLTLAAGQFVVRLTQWSYVDCWMFCQTSGWIQDTAQSFYVSSLPAGAKVSFTFPTAWGDWVKVDVDPLNQVTERDETNNTYFNKPTYTY
jgi:hypothetical protein